MLCRVKTFENAGHSVTCRWMKMEVFEYDVIQVIWESIISQPQFFVRLELVRTNPGTNLQRCRVVENGTAVYIQRLFQRKI